MSLSCEKYSTVLYLDLKLFLKRKLLFNLMNQTLKMVSK